MNEKEQLGVKHLYAYHQTEKQAGIIEFGWIEVDSIPLDAPLIIARDKNDPSWDNAATLDDYAIYFSRLTGMSPERLLDKWPDVSRELVAFLENVKPGLGEEAEFILGLANLIKEQTTFESYEKVYELAGTQFKLSAISNGLSG